MTEIIPIEQQITLEGVKLTPSGIIWSKGGVSVETWDAIGAALKAADRALNWCIGDWLRYGENGRIPQEKYLQAISMFQKDEQTLRNMASVSKAFSLEERRPGLDWSHHMVVRSLPEIAREELLDEAEPLTENESPRLSVKSLRERVRAYQAQEEAVMSPAPSEWIEDLSKAGHEFATVLADPDWSMDVEELTRLPVARVVAEQSYLFLWTPSRKLFDAKAIFAFWGDFKLKSTLVWLDDRDHHLLLVGTKGGGKLNFAGWDQTFFNSQPITGEKRPSVFREEIERTFPGPRLQLFSEGVSEGWCSYQGTA